MIATLVIVPTREYLLTGGTQEDRMLILSHVTSLDITERGIGLDNADVTQILESTQILLLSSIVAVHKGRPTIWPFKPSPAHVVDDTRNTILSCCRLLHTNDV